MSDHIGQQLVEMEARLVVLERALGMRDCRKCKHFDISVSADWCNHYNRLAFARATCDAWESPQEDA